MFCLFLQQTGPASSPYTQRATGGAGAHALKHRRDLQHLDVCQTAPGFMARGSELSMRTRLVCAEVAIGAQSFMRRRVSLLRARVSADDCDAATTAFGVANGARHYNGGAAVSIR
jgi:hypothetical protein